MEKLTKNHDKKTHEKDRVMNNMNDKSDNVVNNFDNVDDGFIPLNNEVHDRSEPVNERVTKDVDLCKIVLNRKYLKWIATRRKISREALTFEWSVQLLENITMKD
ncbi:unnamed protein product [Vicia faba]|uniref:Uncharacterized protein n=1 Tax=Vicia faba TaxID=3906 RepID=A0AAV1ACX3_VICFA|nr:unnamed protein product [Vicia faba]